MGEVERDFGTLQLPKFVALVSKVLGGPKLVSKLKPVWKHTFYPEPEPELDV